MATITGSVFNLKQAAAVNSTIRFRYASAPAEANGGLVASGVPVTAKVSVVGTFSAVLTMGDYLVTIESSIDNPEDLFRISVPDDSNSYDIIGLIVSDVTQSPTEPAGASVPNATSTVIGSVKLVKNTTLGVGVITPGVFFPTNVAALKAIPTDLTGNTFAILVEREIGEPACVRWSSSSMEADDTVGFTVIKPTDRSGGQAGRWIQFVF